MQEGNLNLCTIQRFPHSGWDSRVAEWLSDVGLIERIGKKPATLTGQVMRVLLLTLVPAAVSSHWADVPQTQNVHFPRCHCALENRKT